MRSQRSRRKGTRRPGGLGTPVDFGSSDQCKRPGPYPPPREVGPTASLRWSPTVARSCPCGLRVALRWRFGGGGGAVVVDDGFPKIPRTEAPFVVFFRISFRQREREKEKWDSINCVSLKCTMFIFLDVFRASIYREKKRRLLFISWCFNLLLQDSVWLICCWICVYASGFMVFGFQFWDLKSGLVFLVFLFNILLDLN